MSKNTTTTPVSTLKSIAGKFATQVKSTDTARVKAGRLAYEYVVTHGGKAATLAETAGITAGKVSKHVLTGKALTLCPDADENTQRAIVRCAHEGDGDRKAMVKSVKDEDPAGVVAAALAVKPTPVENDEDEDEGKGEATTVDLAGLSSDALIDLYRQVTEVLAERDDVRGERADRMLTAGKSITTIAKNLAAIVLA